MGDNPADDDHWTKDTAIPEDADVPDSLKDIGSEENLTKTEIERVIRVMSRSDQRFCTVAEIAEEIGITSQTVRNHIDDVVEERPYIHTRKAGQTPVYYYDDDRSKELEEEEGVRNVVQLSETRHAAAYGQVKEAPEDSPFDYVVQWYDASLNKIPDYLPTSYEVGAVAPALNKAVSVNYMYDDQSDLEGEENTTSMGEILTGEGRAESLDEEGRDE